MEFGIFSNGNRMFRPAAEAWDEDLWEIALADELGFQEAWISEHATLAELILCRAAAMTRRIRLGPGVRTLPLHHPVQVVSDANSCDQLTHGRYLMGFGGTLRPAKLMERGLDPALARDMMYESLDFMLKCWAGEEPFDYHGQFWSGKGISVRPKPYQLPHPPLATACHEARETVEMAGRMGVIPLFSQFDTGPRMAQALGYYEDAARAAGRPVSRAEVRACRFVYVSDSVAKAREELEPTMSYALEAEKVNTPWVHERWVPEGGTVMDITFDHMVSRDRYIIGDADTVSEKLEAFYRATGGFGVLMLHMGRDYGERQHRERSLRLFMDQVAPRLRALEPEAVAA
ncbi:MAG TPA: LLM class flavin-dependent oxidoreductase [Chloroflexota bacterium]|nr:LLM class flavin-dependent oxidoreductase [Chloroflexota bacterium]